jgi:hypothetical protein
MQLQTQYMAGNEAIEGLSEAHYTLVRGAHFVPTNKIQTKKIVLHWRHASNNFGF